MSTVLLQYGRMLLGWFISWFEFAYFYGQLNDIGNTYLSTFGLAAPLLLVPAFALLETRLHDSAWVHNNPRKNIGLAWIFGAVGYFPALLIIVGLMWILSFVARS